MASSKQDEIAAEQKFVNHAYARLEEMRESATRLRDQGFADGTISDEDKARLRDHDPAILRLLADRDAMVFHAAQLARRLDAADDGLVFGRLDLTSHEVRYVGRIGIRTRDHDSLVVDWRAPAAEPFYRATPEDPRNVARRRVLHCRGRRVVDLEDTLLDSAAGGDLVLVGDGAFLGALARARDGIMRDIVATIQRQQDDVIRAPADATVIVRGGPGTGKTAVALHRVAYLLFRHRQRFGARGVLVIGPSRRFTAYIQRVLPSLGEDGVTLRSLGGLLDGLDAVTLDEPAVARIKGSAVMARVLRRVASEPPEHGPEELRVTFNGTVLRIDSARLSQLRRQAQRRGRRGLNRSRPLVARLLLDALWDRFRASGAGAATYHVEREEFDAHIRDQRAFTDFLRSWWPIRDPVDVLLSLGDPRRLRRAARRDLTPDQAHLLSTSWKAQRPGDNQLTFQDIALLDELRAILGPQRIDPAHHPNDEEYAHIVVDEAQDLSPMQWRMLARRGKHATWTIVEDTAQSVWDDLAASRQAMETALGRRRRRCVFELTTNYRNSAEIAAVTARILRRTAPGTRSPNAVRTTGHHPEVHFVASGDELPAAEAAAKGVLGVVDGTVGIITDSGRAEGLRFALDGLPDRAQVLPAYEAKGLEFDAVVVVEPDGIVDAASDPAHLSGAAGFRTLYVALSRATQRLVVVSTNPRWREILLGGNEADS